jgi:ribose 5-phosphate isomerase B
MNLAFGCDHAGYEDPEPYYAPALIAYLESLGHTVHHVGTDGPGSVDYPDFAEKVARLVLDGRAELGVLLCGTGMGISIAANRHQGIRAAACVTEEMVRLARDHNNANILCIGRRISSIDECKRLIDIFLATGFSGGERHVRRIAKMDQLGHPSQSVS